MSRRLSSLQPFLWAWLLVVVIGVLGALIQFRQSRVGFSSDIYEEPIELPFQESPLYLSNELPFPAVSAQSLWIYDRESQSLLFEQNASVATSVASLAKLMTAFVAYETYDLTDELQVGTASEVEGNSAQFLASDVFTVRELLQALLMFSANDAAQTLAQGQKAEAEQAFVAQMNLRAAQLGMTQTHFQNVTGLDHELQYSSARDLGVLVDTFLNTPFFSQTVRQQVATVQESVTGRKDTIYTTNSMLYRGPQYTGVKTGTTALAGESLIIRLQDTWSIPIATSGGALVDTPVDLVFVLLGSKDRYQDMQRVVDWIESVLRLRNNSVS